MAPSYMKHLKGLDRNISNTRAMLYFLALGYPLTMAASLYYTFKGPSRDFHIKHQSKINIMEKSEKIRNNRRHIIDEVLNIYNGTPNRKTELIYDDKAIFEDPTIYCYGKKPITCLIWGIPSIFRECKIEPNTEEIEHYEDSIVMKFDCTLQFGIWFRFTLKETQYLKLNDENDKIVRHLDMWNHKELYRFHRSEKVVKYINGNYISRVIFGLASGRFIE